MQFINSITPRQVSRKQIGKATMDFVSVFVFSSTLEKKRVSLEVSGTTTVSPCCATQPAMPCPILMRTSLSACEAFPTASSKYSSCFSSSSKRRDQLSGRRNSSIFSMIVRRTWSSCREEVSAFPNSWKTATSPFSRSDDVATLRRRSTAGNWFTSSTPRYACPLWFCNRPSFSRSCTQTCSRLQPKPAQVSRNTIPPRPRLNAVILPQYRLLLKRDAICLWYRRSHLAIFPGPFRTLVPSLPNSFIPQLIHLTVPSRAPIVRQGLMRSPRRTPTLVQRKDRSFRWPGENSENV